MQITDIAAQQERKPVRYTGKLFFLYILKVIRVPCTPVDRDRPVLTCRNNDIPLIALTFDPVICRKEVEQLGVKAEFISLDEGVSRINLKLKSIDGTEINGRGPRIPREAVDALMTQLDRLGADDTLVLAGSIPASMPDDIYQKIMERLDGRDVRIVVDATKDLLLNVLGHHPFLIKPNNHELGDIFGVKLSEREEVVPYAKKLQEKGAVNVLVSMAGKGAVLLAEDGSVYAAEAPKGTLKNGVGAGDSMVAGFLAGYGESGDYEHAFRMGLAAGSASAFSEQLATKDEIKKVYENCKITKIG